MTIASDLAAFVTQQRYADLPPRAIEYAEMLISRHGCQRGARFHPGVLQGHPGA